MDSVSWASGQRMGATIAVGVGALIVLTNCAPRQEAEVPHPSDALVSEATLLPREVYLLALDSLLGLAHPERNPTFVQGTLPVRWSDLQSRHVEFRRDFNVCPGETLLGFLPPEKRDGGRVELEVVEAFGNHGLAGSRVFVFGGAGPDYELIRTLPGNSDRLVACWGHKT